MTDAVLPAATPLPASTPDRSRPVLVGVVALVCLPIVVAAAGLVAGGWIPTGDDAIESLQVADVPGHLPLVGLTSRFGFSHPGPLLFYLLAPFRWAFGPPGLVVGAAAIGVGAAAGSALLLARRGGVPLLLGGGVVLLALERSMAGGLADPWTPWVTLLPFWALLLLAWSVWDRDWAALPWLVATGSFLVQTHLGYGIVTAGLVIPAVGAAAWSALRSREPSAGDPARCPPRWLAAAVVVGVLLWLPPLVEQLTGDPGNMANILTSFREPSLPGVGWGAAPAVVARHLGPTFGWVSGAEPVDPGTLGGLAGTSPVLLAPLGLALVAAAAFAVSDGHRRELGAVVVAGWVALLAVASVAGIVGPAYPYLVRWIWIVAAFGWMAAAWTAWVVLDGRGLVPSRVVGGLGGLLGALLAVSAVAASVAALTVERVDDWTVETTADVVDPVAAAIQDGRRVVVNPVGPGLPGVAFGLVAALEERGLPVVMLDAWGPAVGEHRTVGSDPPDIVVSVVTGADQIKVQRTLTGAPPVLERSALSAEERDELLVLRFRALEAAAGGPALSDDERARLAELGARDATVAIFIDRSPGRTFVPAGGG